MTRSILQDKSFAFATKIVRLHKQLIDKHEFTLSRQLLKSGTAIGALVRESKNAESTADFIHKLAIAQKECDETIYWIDLLNSSQYIEAADFDGLRGEAIQRLKMIRSSIITTKRNKQSNGH